MAQNRQAYEQVLEANGVVVQAQGTVVEGIPQGYTGYTYAGHELEYRYDEEVGDAQKYGG